MRLKHVLIGFALVGPASAGGAQFAENEVKHYADNEVVQFVNQMSDVVSVRVDGADACQLAPGESCTARLSGTDADVRHDVHAETASGTWDDTVKISECHWNWQGLKTFTFTDERTSFDCANTFIGTTD